VAVCIPEFLSLYETERLVQELVSYEIDIHNIVINFVVFPGNASLLFSPADDQCKLCASRSKMQRKYITQIFELYDDFHITIVPLQDEEVRGVPKLRGFSQLLLIEQQYLKKE